VAGDLALWQGRNRQKAVLRCGDQRKGRQSAQEKGIRRKFGYEVEALCYEKRLRVRYADLSVCWMGGGGPVVRKWWEVSGSGECASLR